MKLLVPILLNCFFVIVFYLLDKKTSFKLAGNVGNTYPEDLLSRIHKEENNKIRTKEHN